MSRSSSLATNPVLRNFAQDAAQNSIRRVADFLAPSVEVPTLTGKYKVYSAIHRYKRPKTRRAAHERATMLGFSASDANYSLEGNALDFPIDNEDGLNDEGLLNQAQYGAQLVADAAGMTHESETLALALSTLGAGTDLNVAASNYDLVDVLDTHILNVMKAAKNGAGIRVLFGVTAWRRTKNHASIRAQFKGGGGKANSTPAMPEVSDMLIGKPEMETAFMVEDTAADGVAESINFMLDTQVIIFACNARPNTMDPSFMKTFRLMGGWMKPGSYQREDERGEVLKMDWHEQIAVTNSVAAVRLNLNIA